MRSNEIIYGMNPVTEALKSGARRIHRIYMSDRRGGRQSEAIRSLASKKNIEVEFISKGDISNLSKTEKHQGVAAEIDKFAYVPLEEIVDSALKNKDKGFLVILDGITDPQNLGSLLRTALLSGVDGIILPRDNSAHINPTVVKASAGATEYLPVAEVTNISRTINYLKEKGFWTAAAASGGCESIYQQDFSKHNIAIILGSEGSGVRKLVKKSCDYILSIPMKGEIDSYNVSVAGAIFMSEISRQRL